MTDPTFATDGFEIRRGVVSAGRLGHFRAEAVKVAEEAGTACVRHLTARSEVFAELARSAEISALLPVGLRPVRSILFDKTPEQNWPVAWHQDLTISVAEKREVDGYAPWSVKDCKPHVQPPIGLLENMVTVRLHLDDTPTTNGALRVIPGSHLAGRLSQQDVADGTAGNEVVCACGAGDVLLMKPLILHASCRSISPSRRRVIHFEYA
ncbi:MAG: hypothetical protein ACI8XO_003805, partial [Verrucomicrobiales bacterium]